MTPTETTALQIVSAVVISGVCVRLLVEIVRAVRDRDQRNDDDREIGIDDLTDTDAEAFRAEVDQAHADIHDAIAAGICPLHPGEPADDCGQGCVWLTVRAQIDDRRTSRQPQPDPGPEDPCGPEYWERFERATWKDKW